MGMFRNRVSYTGLFFAVVVAMIALLLATPGLAWAQGASADSSSNNLGNPSAQSADELQSNDVQDSVPKVASMDNGKPLNVGQSGKSANPEAGPASEKQSNTPVVAMDAKSSSNLSLVAQEGDSARQVLTAQEKKPDKTVLAAQGGDSTKTTAITKAEMQGVVKDGVYVIASAKSSSRVLDVSGASKKNGANVLLWNDNGQTNQQWRISFDKASGKYSIVSVNSNLALAFSSAKSGANVYQKSLSGSASYLWSITATSSGYVVAPAGATGIALDIQGGAGGNGDNIELWTSNNKPWQRYWFAAVNPQLDAKKTIDDGVYTIARADSKGQLIDVEGASQRDVANVLLYHSNGGFNQRWYVSRDKNNLYTLTSVNSGKSLDISGESRAPGGNVIQYASHGRANQKWQIRDNGNGTYSIISKHNGLALSASGSADCSNIIVFADNNASSERFVFTKSMLVGNGVYSIASCLNQNEVLDVPNASKADDLQAALWSYNKGMNQKYQLVDQGGETYTIQAAHSGKYLEDANGRVVQRSKKSGNAQLWKAAWYGTGVVLTNQATKRSITISGSARNGAPLATASTSGNGSQRLSFVSRNLIEDGLYTLRSGTGGRVLDVNGASTANSANIQLWASNDGDNQKFDVNAVSGGYYKIVNYNSGKAVTAASGAAGANVRQSSYSGSASQLWRAEIAPNGGVVFVCKQSGQVLSVANNANTNGANVQLGTKSGASGQTWNLAETRPHDIVLSNAIAQANARGSSTNYFIAVDLANHRTVVLYRSGNTWKDALNVTVSTGAPGTPTVTGEFSVGSRGYSFGSGYTCYYWTQFYGGYLFHSVLYNEGTFTIQDGRLGYSISHGCVRMNINDAHWIYDNVPSGTKVYVY